MTELTIKLTNERLLTALATFSSITTVPVSEVVDTAVVEDLVSNYLVEFFTTAMMDIELGQELRHPNIVTFVAEYRKFKLNREKEQNNG